MVPILCIERMPEPELRVLAYVPQQAMGRRWRVAQWCAAPAQYIEPHWRDEETEVGDGRIYWKPEQVTHWMPLPAEPGQTPPRCADGGLSHDFKGQANCPACGWAPRLAITGPDSVGPALSDTPKQLLVVPFGVYAGDGHPLARYQREPNEPEPERGP